jgi:hypothetical protein
LAKTKIQFLNHVYSFYHPAAKGDPAYHAFTNQLAVPSEKYMLIHHSKRKTQRRDRREDAEEFLMSLVHLIHYFHKTSAPPRLSRLCVLRFEWCISMYFSAGTVKA